MMLMLLLLVVLVQVQVSADDLISNLLLHSVRTCDCKVDDLEDRRELLVVRNYCS